MTGWYDERHRQGAEDLAARLEFLETYDAAAMVTDLWRGPQGPTQAAVSISVRTGVPSQRPSRSSRSGTPGPR